MTTILIISKSYYTHGLRQCFTRHMFVNQNLPNNLINEYFKANQTSMKHSSATNLTVCDHGQISWFLGACFFFILGKGDNNSHYFIDYLPDTAGY